MSYAAEAYTKAYNINSISMVNNTDASYFDLITTARRLKIIARSDNPYKLEGSDRLYVPTYIKCPQVIEPSTFLTII